MANVTINSVESLNNDVLELKSKVNNSLKSNIDYINSVLSSIGNYSNNGLSANIGDISSYLKSNFDNGLDDMINATENIFNYASYINEFNVDDYDSNSKPVSLTDKYNSSYLNIVDTNIDNDNNPDSEKSTNNDNIIPSSAILINDIKDKLSENSLSIINNVTFDNEGFAKFENRYIIQMNGVFGDVGDYIDITQSDGSILNCIIGLTDE